LNTVLNVVTGHEFEASLKYVFDKIENWYLYVCTSTIVLVEILSTGIVNQQ
jgi:hypothetical protein